MSDFYNWQGAGAARAQSMNTLSPHLQGLMSWLLQNYGGSNVGGHVDRPVRGGSAPSSHAFGAATDWGYQDRTRADQVIDQITSNPAAYGIQAIHDYDRMRVWRAGRGWKTQEKGSHGGLMKPGTHHLHFEVSEANFDTPFGAVGRGGAAGAGFGGIGGSAGIGAIGRGGPAGGGIGGIGAAQDPLNWQGIQQWMGQNETTFHSWLQTQPKATQDSILGKLRQDQDLAGIAAMQKQYGQPMADYFGYLSKLPGEVAQSSVDRVASGEIITGGTSSTGITSYTGGASGTDNSEAIFKAWLRTQSPDVQRDVITRVQQDNDLTGIAALQDQYGQGVADYMGYLSRLPRDAALASVNSLSAEAAPSAAPESAGSPEMTDLLKRLGVNYPNAPQPTPALLAFLNGLGLNLQTADDLKKRAIERIGAATSDAMADIDRTAGRTKQNITADLIRRNIVSSGESTTRYARQAEDVAETKSDVETAGATAKTSAEDAYQQAADVARQQALDRVISAEEQQATQKASSSAQEDIFKRQQAATDLAWQREQQAQSEALKAQTDAIAQAAARGVVV